MSFLFALLHLLVPSAMAQMSCNDIFVHSPRALDWADIRAEMRARNLNLPVINHFSLIEATSALAQARVVIIGDAHKVAADPHQVAIRQAENYDRAFIEKFINPKTDIVLMERTPGSTERDPLWALFFQHRGIRSEGWDNQRYNQLGQILISEVNRLAQLLQSHPELNHAQSAEFQLFLIARLAADYVIIEKRDEALLQSLRTHLAQLPPGGKIFVVAGTEHALDNYQIIYSHLQDHHIPYVGIRGNDIDIPSWNPGILREAALETFEVNHRKLDEIILNYVDTLLREMEAP